MLWVSKKDKKIIKGSVIMFYQHIEKMVKNCYLELIQAPDQEIQEALDMLKCNVPEERFEEVVSRFLMDGLRMAKEHDMSEADFDEFFIMNLKGFAQHSFNIKKSIVVDVKLKGQEENINRVLEIPYVFTVADLAYVILASMNAMASHLFSITHKKVTYYCGAYESDVEEEVWYATEFMLDELKLKKGSKMDLVYDFGDNFEFEIKVKEIKNNSEAFGIDQIHVIKGSGYGIWEEAHYEMNLYYDHPDEFASFIKENELYEEMYPCDEVFDCDEMNEAIAFDLMNIKHVYECFDDEDNRNEYMK